MCRASLQNSQKCGSLNQDPWFSDSMIWVSAFLSISQGGEHPKQAWEAAMGTCSWQGYLWHWFCYGPGTAWRALNRWEGPHLRRIHWDHLGDFPNIVHRKKEQLFLLNKRGPPFTSAQALLPDRMARHRGYALGRDEICISQHVDSTTDTSGLYTCICSVWVKTTMRMCPMWEWRALLPLLAHPLSLTTGCRSASCHSQAAPGLVGMLPLCWIFKAFGERPAIEVVQCDRQRWEAVLP